MEDILALYEMPYNPCEPVICFDEKSIQLLKDKRPGMPTQPYKPRRKDYEYEYKRNGTRDLFVVVEPKRGYRNVTVTKRCTNQDFAREIHRLATIQYKNAQCIHIVLDNLNTHFEKSLIETFGIQKTNALMRRIQFHYTPVHASWLNMAEIEVSILSRQCLSRRIPTEIELHTTIGAWQKRRNQQEVKIHWKFTRTDARKAFNYKTSELN
jgi:hypothetical protein